MKLSAFTFIFSALIFATIISGCETSTQKEGSETAYLKELPKDLHEKSQTNVDDAEWRIFKNEYSIKFENNKIRIAELKEQMIKPEKILDPLYAKRIDNLEQKNKDLKIKMDAYGSNKADWKSFKQEFNHDMYELAKSLKDFTVDNKE